MIDSVSTDIPETGYIPTVWDLSIWQHPWMTLAGGIVTSVILAFIVRSFVCYLAYLPAGARNPHLAITAALKGSYRPAVMVGMLAGRSAAQPAL